MLRVVEYSDGALLDIIPSQLELSYTLKNPSQKEHLLSNFIDSVQETYNLILIDCAPTESVLTTAAYLATDNVLIPVKPEFLSTIGLPLIQQSILEFQKLFRKSLNITGACFNMCSGYYPEEDTSKNDVRTVASRFNWHVFDEDVPYFRSFPKGARAGNPIFRTSRARSKVTSKVEVFCNAFAREVKLRLRAALTG